MEANKLKKEDCLALLQSKQKNLLEQGETRYPKRSDFSDREVTAIKAFLGPWPRALEAAGLKPPRDSEKVQKKTLEKRIRSAKRRREGRLKKQSAKNSGFTPEDVSIKKKHKRRKQMKTTKILATTLLSALAITASGLLLQAEETDSANTANLFISLSDGEGKLVLAQEKIAVSDQDGDGTLTLNDAFICLHNEKFEGGADAGFASSSGWITKLWGVENGGGYGYYLNNQSASSLTDPIADGDYLNAFLYTDLTTWSDSYSYFTLFTASATEGDSVTLTLLSSGYDENWSPITKPVSGASVTVNGTVVGTTNEEGKITFTADTVGTFTVSATSSTQTLVPPVCTLTVSESSSETENPEQKPEAPATGDSLLFTAALALLTTIGLITYAGFSSRRNREN